MIRLIKRYGSRKLYDTEESRYVLLEEIAGWIRLGQEVKVVDNKTAEDVTAQTLTQIISEEGRKGTGFLPNDLLHDIIRFGQDAVNTGVARIQHGVDKLVQVSIDRLGPVRKAREEMDVLRRRLEELEISLVQLEVQRGSDAVAAPTRPARKPRKSPAAPRQGAARGKARAGSRAKKEGESS